MVVIWTRCNIGLSGFPNRLDVGMREKENENPFQCFKGLRTRKSRRCHELRLGRPQAEFVRGKAGSERTESKCLETSTWGRQVDSWVCESAVQERGLGWGHRSSRTDQRFI